MITITYFGPLKTLQPLGSEAMDWHGGTTNDLMKQLRGRGAAWDAALQPQRIFKLAINRQLLHGSATIHDGDEVAIMPPVTGG